MHPNTYIPYIIELLSPFGHITTRSMFGGCGVYCDNIIVGIVINNVLYFKVDASNQKQYETHNVASFTYPSKGQNISMSYWQVPETILEDSETLGKWLRQSYKISHALRKKKHLASY